MDGAKQGACAPEDEWALSNIADLGCDLVACGTELTDDGMSRIRDALNALLGDERSEAAWSFAIAYRERNR